MTSEGNLSEALDQLVTDARTGGGADRAVRSVAGTVRLPADEPDLNQAKAVIRALFEESLARPLVVREDAEPYRSLSRAGTTRRKRRARRA